jgi:hypothetical protein
METRLNYFALILILFSVGTNAVLAQQFHRFSADYTIKYNDRSGKQVMKMGRVFYDSNKNKIVIKNGFPVKEHIVYNDTSIYFIRAGNIVKHESIISPIELSIFHLALNGQLANYGLDKLGYTIENVKKDKGLIIASWIPPEKYKNKLGKILISTKNKRLFGIIFLDAKEKIVSKHRFNKYVNIKGFEFPSEVIRINYFDNYELYELTSYRKILIDEHGNDDYYNYQLPKR